MRDICATNFGPGDPHFPFPSSLPAAFVFARIPPILTPELTANPALSTYLAPEGRQLRAAYLVAFAVSVPEHLMLDVWVARVDWCQVVAAKEQTYQACRSFGLSFRQLYSVPDTMPRVVDPRRRCEEGDPLCARSARCTCL